MSERNNRKYWKQLLYRLRAALEDEFSAASGQYFDNDKGWFASPHPDALDPQKCREIVRVIETILAQTFRKL